MVFRSHCSEAGNNNKIVKVDSPPLRMGPLLLMHLCAAKMALNYTLGPTRRLVSHSTGKGCGSRHSRN